MGSTRKGLAKATLTLVVVLSIFTPARAPAQTEVRAEALGRYADAAAEFEQAYALKPDPAILYDAAQANRLAGKKERALELYRNYRRAYGRRAEHGAEVDKRITELEKAVDSDRHAPAAAVPLVTTEPRPVVAAPVPATAPRVPPPLPAAPPERPTTAATLVAQPPTPTPSSNNDSPIYKQWWFWTGAGVVVAAAVVGIALASRKTSDCGAGVDYCANTGL
jgi:tetratricopeptide (TPR) repeat protein